VNYRISTGIGGYPNIKLFEPDLGPFFEFTEELPSLGDIRNIYEYADQIVAITLTFALPKPSNHLSLGGDRTKLLF
jgi:hypothetical protein